MGSDDILFGPRGELRDFIPRQGDPTPAQQAHLGRHGQRRRWGKRVLIATPDVFPVVANISQPRLISDSATLVDTGDFGRTHSVDVQVRYGVSGAAGVSQFQPPSVFTAINPTSSFGAILFTLRRGLDQDAPTAQDTYLQDLATGLNDILPFDVVQCRSLGVDARLVASPTTGGPAPCAIWLECIATLVDTQSKGTDVPGYFTTPNANAGIGIAAVASPTSATLLSRRNARTQLMVSNTSTNADMIVSMGGATASWGTAPFLTFANWRGSFVLPRNSFAVYESPVGGWAGPVTATWNNAAPDNGALVFEGAY